MTVEILPRARADIITQFRFYMVANDVPDIAIQFRSSVLEPIARLKAMPNIGVPVTGIHGLRSWPVIGFGSLRIYYRHGDRGIEVVRILHAERNVRQILKKENQIP